MMKRYPILLLVALLTLVAQAQRSALYSTADASLTEGKTLYQSGHYAASQQILNSYLSGDIADESMRDEAEFYYAANAFELRQKQASKLMKAYAKEHTYSPYLSEVHYMQGVLAAEKKKFKAALKEFEQVNPIDLFRQHVDGCMFYKGYAYLYMNEPRAALTFFQRLHNNEASEYYLQSRYYYGYCQYVLGNYTKALPDFLFVEQTDQYKGIAPYYIIQIYFAQQKYDEVLSRADELLRDDPENVNNCELYRVLGEIEYQQGNYVRAIDHLRKYEEMGSKQNVPLVREDLYLLGMSCYKTERYPEAIEYLKKVKAASDSLSQSSQYHMGNAIIKSMTEENKMSSLMQAKNCFAAAMRMDYSKKLQEEAMFNYALTTYESSTAIEGSGNVFIDFLNKYPKSKHKEEVYSLMSDAFMKSKDYEAALNALSKIKAPTNQMQETKQFLRYQIGADYFLKKNNVKAIEYFDEVLAHAGDAELASSRDNRIYKTEALYMKAEASYRLQKYDQAAASMSEFQQQANASKSNNYDDAQYLEGYIYFQQKQYKKAENAFLNFLQVADKSQATYPDALNRIGDCYFSQRDFVKAESYYARVIELGAAGADYATFQRGYALGLLKRYGDKITTLERLVATYPRSDYADDGLYEIARAELQRNDNRAAIAAYNRLLDTYPNSNMARKAALEKAMLYYNDKELTKAMDAYKFVIKNYPSTEEAYAALEGLEVCYVEDNKVNEYLAYTKTLGRINMQTTATKEDSLTYTAAELQYMQGNYEPAAKGLKNYLDKYCDGGRYCTAAQYFCADAYYQLGKKDAALREFKALCEIKSNPYMETALMRTAELCYDREAYGEALNYFRRLLQQASESKTTNVARLGILRCSYYLGDNESTIAVASELIDDPSTDAGTMEEARFNRAKAYYAKGLYIKAIEDFRPLATEARTAQGAESKYLIAEALFMQGDMQESEDEIMSFAGMNTSQQYWLAKAFILLADIYVRQGDDFQAEQYLLSLQANYRNTDDIQPTISERLQLIHDRNAERVVEEEDDEDKAPVRRASRDEDDEDDDDDDDY